MRRTSDKSAVEPGFLASLGGRRPASGSRMHKPASPFAMEQLEDRILMSRGSGGGVPIS